VADTHGTSDSQIAKEWRNARATWQSSTDITEVDARVDGA
jgi:hypothetical protein